MGTEYDVAVIGAGAAGLAAAQELLRAGLRVCCLEARDRVGGRIFTVHDARSPVPIELGAEFVHGRPEEIFDLAEGSGIGLYPVGGRPVTLDGGDAEEDSDRVMQDLVRSASEEHDETFQSFLEGSNYSAGIRGQAIGYVEGFNAAPRDVIGVASLAQDRRAADRIGGDSSFRVREGYDTLIRALATGVEVRLHCVVDAIEWKAGEATVRIGPDTVRARRVLVTVPLGVLQNGAIKFDPEPADTLAAARALRFGDALRVTFLFDRAYWDEIGETAGAGFVFTDEPAFPVWWTGRPVEARVITGWTAGPKADALLGRSDREVIGQALDTLARILKTRLPEPQGAWFQDWHGDPFSRGAYSYVPAGALAARRRLAEPVAGTLYFAGEATDLVGYGGTVHGAIASGRRAAAQILAG